MTFVVTKMLIIPALVRSFLEVMCRGLSTYKLSLVSALIYIEEFVLH